MLQNQSHTLIGVTKTAVFFLYAALAIIGFAIGYFIPQIAKWALSLPWILLKDHFGSLPLFRDLQLHLSLLFSVCVRGFGSLILLLQCCCLSKLQITQWNSSKEKKCKQFIPMTSLLYLWITNGLSSWNSRI